MSIFSFLFRAFASNLRTVSAGRGESATLEATGIREPRIQGYFAWRRSLMAVVVVATILSAGLATYRDLTETGERPGVFQGITEQLMKGAGSAAPSAEIKHAIEEIKESLPVDEVKEAIQDAKDNLPVEEVKEAVEGAKEALNAVREEMEDAEEEPAKEAGSPKSTPSATATPEKEVDDPDEPETAFGKFADGVHLVSLYALPVAALIAVFCWTRFRLSFQIILVGFAFSFFVPMLLAICPWSWWGYDEPNLTPGKDPAEYFKQMSEGLVEGAEYLITLFPTVLSLIPGVQRACLRVKTLLPESMLPGWFLVAAAPFYALFLLVAFVGVNQVASDPLFLVGMFLFLAAPVIYLAKSDAFTSAVSSDEDFRRMRGVQRIVGIVTMLAGVLLVIYLTTQQVLGVHLVGLDAKTSLLRPIDLVGMFLEFIGRSMFMTVLGADLFMRMNLTTWKNHRAFSGTPAAEGYDRVMADMERAVK